MTPSSIRHLFQQLLLVFSLLFIAQTASALNAEDLLPPEKAFALQAERQGGQVVLTLEVADGYYLYRDRSKFSTDPAGLLSGTPLPPGKMKDDPYFGRLAVYLPGTTQITLPLQATAPEKFKLEVVMQGCADAGLCYPPYTYRFDIGSRSSASNWLQALAPTPATQTDSSPAAANLASTLLTFFVAGLGLAFTACMYPLLPIVSSLIAGQGQHITRRRGFMLSFSYVQGLAVCYTIIGIIAGLTGSLLSVWLQQPVVILSASALMVVLALSMFGLFSLQLPASWQTRIADSSNRLSGGKIATVFGMGALSALLIGPCIAPPLVVALGYIGQQGNAVLGGLALYAMALGLGTPLILLGTLGGQLLPKAGQWMNRIKAVFGTIMLAVAIWLAAPFVPAWLAMLAWAALAAGSAVFLGAFEPLPGNARSIHKLAKALGLMLALAAAIQLIGIFSGASSARQPLAQLLGSSAAAGNSELAWRKVGSPSELQQALQTAAGKPVMLDFYADWCVACIEMEQTTFRDPQVRAAFADMVLLKADVTANNSEHQALLKQFGLYGPPGMIFYNRQGKENHRLIGYTATDEFLPPLQKLLSGV